MSPAHNVTTPVGRYLDVLIDLEATLATRAGHARRRATRLDATGHALEATGARTTSAAYGEGARALARARGRYIDEGLAAASGEREARTRGALEAALAHHLPAEVVRAAAADAWSAVLDAEEGLATDIGDRRRDAP